MENKNAKELARVGQGKLEEAVLTVLYEARRTGDACLGPAEISRRADIFRERGKVNIINDAIVTGLLVCLHEKDKVEKCTQRERNVGGWEISDAEFERRQNDG